MTIYLNDFFMEVMTQLVQFLYMKFPIFLFIPYALHQEITKLLKFNNCTQMYLNRFLSTTFKTIWICKIRKIFVVWILSLLISVIYSIYIVTWSSPWINISNNESINIFDFIEISNHWTHGFSLMLNMYQ